MGGSSQQQAVLRSLRTVSSTSQSTERCHPSFHLINIFSLPFYGCFARVYTYKLNLFFFKNKPLEPKVLLCFHGGYFASYCHLGVAGDKRATLLKKTAFFIKFSLKFYLENVNVSSIPPLLVRGNIVDSISPPFFVFRDRVLLFSPGWP